MELPFKVNGDQTITCPHYVGALRGVRELDSQVNWSLNQLRPRYNQFPWPDMWRNIRLKNRQALQTSVSNESVGVITVSAVETPPIVVSISGPTSSASEATEDITMDALTKQTVNQYIDYVSVKKDRVNLCDVTLSDVDGKVLTVIPNNRLEALYQVVDVSSCPWLSISTNKVDHYLELLFKKALPWLENDNDEYPVPRCDNVLVNKMLQLWNEEQGKVDIAAAYDAKATRSLSRKTEDQNRATEDTVALVQNPHDSISPRIRQGRRRYYRGYGSRGHGF
jgi:hypothetical protein